MWLGQRAPRWGQNPCVYIVVPSQCYRLWRKPRGSTSSNAVSFWREGVHYSEEYVLFAQRAAMHHTEQRASSPLMRTVQPENCTTPRADTRKSALVIFADSDHQSLEIFPVCQILHHGKRHLRANAVTTCFQLLSPGCIFLGGNVITLWFCDRLQTSKGSKKTQLESALWWWDLITPWQKCRGCFEAEDSIHEYTDTVSSYTDWLPSIILHHKPLFTADVCRKIRKRCSAFKSEDIVEAR